MSKRIARWLAWSSAALSLALTAPNFLLAASRQPPPNLGVWAFVVTTTIGFALFSAFGALIVRHRPANRVGWLFVAIGLFGSVARYVDEYARYALLAGPGTAAELAAWLSNWLGQPLLFLLFLLPLLFPHGSLPSQRWRPVVWLAAGGVTIQVLGLAFAPGSLENLPAYANPFGMSGELPGAAVTVGRLLFLPLVVAVLVSLFHLARGRGDQRQQFKWFVYGTAPIIVGYPVGLALQIASFENVAFVAFALGNLGFIGIPISVGIAVLKYRLYDIDLIINRTLVYVPLTAILTGVYTASIGLSQRVFVAITGEESTAAIVFTTLVVVSAFTPVKNGLQSIVDKRFKEVPDPTKELRNFGEQVRSFVQLSDSQQISRRVLEEAARAFQAEGGAVFLYKNGQPQLVHTVGEWKGETKISVPLESDKTQYGFVALGARKNGLDYTPQDREALQQIVSLVAEAIRLAGHTRSNSL